jgi:DNA-binding winged helix-turn-helix (wHTH) protein
MLYIFGEYPLDTQRYELCRAGCARRLRRKVFQVLVYLLAHPDRVVSKQELCEQVWPQQFAAPARTRAWYPLGSPCGGAYGPGGGGPAG